MARSAIHVGLCIAMAGCTAAMTGEPDASIEPTRDFSAAIINATLDNVVADGRIPDITKMRRNEIIFARMAEIDVLYADFETRFARETRQSEFVLALLGLGVGGAGAFVGEAASQALSAASAGIAGAREAYDRDVLADRTMQAFVSQMRADRARVRADILLKLDADLEIYPLQAAVSDLALYRHAGTLTAALVGIAETAALQEVQASRDLAQTETLVFQRQQAAVTPTSLSLVEWVLDPSLSVEQQRERLAQGQSCFERSAAADKPSRFDVLPQVAGSFPEVTRDVVECLNRDFGAGISAEGL